MQQIFEYYDWNNLIDTSARSSMKEDIDGVIEEGHYWDNCPPYQTNINIFALPGDAWINMKMSFIWSCFAFMKREAQIKGVKSWGYKTNLDTQPENRDVYWHQHVRENNLVVSGVYYLQMPKGSTGTEFAVDGPEGSSIMSEAKLGQWVIFPGKTWHRPGKLISKDYRYIVAADMEL